MVTSLSAPAPAPAILNIALLVDRDGDTRTMYAEFLRLSEAWVVEEAADGREALAKAISAHPDIIVTETRLPGIDGFDLCRLLRGDADTAAIPIIVVTGDASSDDAEKAREAGADVVLVKPCLPEQLLAEISRSMVHASDGDARGQSAGVSAASVAGAASMSSQRK